MKVDLHTHTNRSDGTLEPAELLRRAREAGVEMLAVTDHDTVAAFDVLPSVPGLELITGIELSTNWGTRAVHIVGLKLDCRAPATLEAVARQRQVRAERAERIAQSLVKAGLPDLLAAACSLAGTASAGRPHFARALVDAGCVKDEKQAFTRYLGRGKRGDIKAPWATVAQAIEWIHGAGGIAVLAHPARYKLSSRRLVALVTDFRASGGDAIEVCCGRQDPATTKRLSQIASTFDLLSSAGSDFHHPAQSWLRLGAEALPANCTPVWDAF